MPDRFLDVSHEALIRGWPRLRRWLDEDRAGLRLQRRITEAATEWQRSNRDGDLLYRGARLIQAQEWRARHEAELNPLEREFLDASIALKQRLEEHERAQQQRELDAAQKLAEAERRRADEQVKGRRRQLRLSYGLAVLVLVTGVIAAVAMKQRSATQNAEKKTALQRDEAVRQGRTALSRQLAAQATSEAKFRPDQALLLALAARRIQPTLEATASLGSTLEEFPYRLTYLPAQEEVSQVAFDPRGATLALTGKKRNSVTLWDTATRRIVRALPSVAADSSTTSVVFTPDGNGIFTADLMGSIAVWNLQEKNPKPRFLTEERNNNVFALALSPDGGLLASGGDPTGAVALWDLSNFSHSSLTAAGDHGRTWTLAFNKKGLLAAGTEDGSIVLWDVARRKSVATIPAHAGRVWKLAFHPNDTLLASASDDGTVKLWDVNQRSVIGAPIAHASKESIFSVAFSPDGSWLATGGRDNEVCLWELESRRLVHSLPIHRNTVLDVKFSPDGRLLLSGSNDGTGVLWEPGQSNALVQTLEEHKDLVTSVQFIGNTNRQNLVSSGRDAMFMWDPSGRRKPIRLSAGVGLAVMNPSGDLLCLSGENEIDLFDVSTGKPSGDPLKAEKTESTTSLAVSPDSELLAQGTKDGKVILWNLRQRSRIGSPLDLGMKGMVTGVAFSPDSRVLATAKFSELRLWDVSTREPMGESFVGHEKRRLIWSVAFSPDGKILASGAFDGTTVLWDLASRRQLVRLHGHVGRVFGAAFSLDGKLLATSGEDKKVLLWQVDPASWERIACSIVNRNFNQVEWKEFTGGYPYVKTCPDLPSSHDAKSDNSQSQQ